MLFTRRISAAAWPSPVHVPPRVILTAENSVHFTNISHLNIEILTLSQYNHDRSLKDVIHEVVVVLAQ